MSLDNFFEQLNDHCVPLENITFEWSAKNCGFGQFYFYYDDEGKLHCSSELMSRNFVKNMLIKMVDDCIFDDEERQVKHNIKENKK